MEREPLLMLPGPVPMPERVRMAMSRQAINHRGKEFGDVYAACVKVLKTAFGTENDLFIIRIKRQIPDVGLHQILEEMSSK